MMQTASAAADPPQSLTRYKSTRKVMAQQAAKQAYAPSPSAAPPPVPTIAVQETPAEPNSDVNGMQRSMSRYRRGVKPSPAPAQPPPPQPTTQPPTTTERRETRPNPVQRSKTSPADRQQSRKAVEAHGVAVPVAPVAAAEIAAVKAAVPAQVSRSSTTKHSAEGVHLTSRRKSSSRRQGVSDLAQQHQLQQQATPPMPQSTIPQTTSAQELAKQAQRKRARVASQVSPAKPVQPDKRRSYSNPVQPVTSASYPLPFESAPVRSSGAAMRTTRSKEDFRQAGYQQDSDKVQLEAKKMLVAEAERQRNMQTKLRAEKDKKRAEERQLRQQQQTEEKQAAREKYRQEAIEKKAQAQKRQQDELDQKARQKQEEIEDKERKEEEQAKKLAESRANADSRHKRNKSKEELHHDHVHRQRSGALAKLTGIKLDSRDGSKPSEATKKADANKSYQQADLKSAASKDKMAFLKKKKGDEAPKPRDKHVNSNEVINAALHPGIDAPISAVNAGERRVLVECNKSSIYLPVTPTTTPVDLIRSAETCLNEPIKLNCSVLLESFGKVGVQRPLRKYEHIRDVMNSWDDDRQNSLLLVPSATDGNDEDLDSKSVPREQPDEMSCSLLYSQKPGKWDKKFITLRSDGQVTAAKNEDGKDATNICHLTDFDIYTPDPKTATKMIKPPKKLCFAIKSQQKSNMFLSTENFVHFFCTGDKRVAAQWYKAVQGWRSWYLVNVLGEGKKVDKKEAGVKDGLSGNRQIPGSRDSHYQLGSFKPLLDFDTDLFKSSEPLMDTNDLSGSLQRSPTTRGAAPPSSFPRRFAADTDENSHPTSPQKNTFLSQPFEDGTFAPTGLLGRSYSQRQKMQKEREQGAQRTSGPFINGPSLLNDREHNLTARPSMEADENRGAQGGTARPSMELGRSTSTRQKPKPLIDLTPQYREPPQHARKGKGYQPDNVGPGGLIDAATSPEYAINVPPATDWRARPTTRGESNTVTRSNSVERSKPQHHTVSSGGGAGDVPQDEPPKPNPFTENGLVSALGDNPSGIIKGKGVMQGYRATGPMVDLTEKSVYAQGSLLRDAEGKQAVAAPVINREKEEAVAVKTGEGFGGKMANFFGAGKWVNKPD